jgi:hypothetical protein
MARSPAKTRPATARKRSPRKAGNKGGAPKGNTNARGNRGGGRPSTYDPALCDLARKLAMVGLTDVETAAVLEVSEKTINNWKRLHIEFRAALKEGKANADANVAHKLYRRACGYSHEAVKIVADAKTGSEHIVPYVEHYPPDTTACIFWLKNRQPARWRDRHELVTLTPEQVADLTDEQLSGILSGQAVDEAKPVN